MIASLTGILKSKAPTEIVVDVQGTGYALSIPLSTFEKLGSLNSTVTLFTYLQVREDSLQLYGFATEDERFLFKQLITVSGIGPRIAQSILSGIAVGDLRSYIAHGNVAALTAIPGVGRKTAERLVVELRDKLGKAGGPTDAGAQSHDDIRSQAFLALTSLGYTKQSAEKAIRAVLNESNGIHLSLEELIKRALRLQTSQGS